MNLCFEKFLDTRTCVLVDHSSIDIEVIGTVFNYFFFHKEILSI